MDVTLTGAVNLAEFVRRTAGRNGTTADVRGGVVVAGPIDVPNAYVTAAIPTQSRLNGAEFIDDAVSFFAELNRTFVLWAPATDTALVDEALSRGLFPDGATSPAMVTIKRVTAESALRLRLVHDDETAAIFGDLCERGYEKAGMAWLMAHQQSYSAEGSYWHIAFDGDVPVSAACGFLSGESGETGGLYSVGTPPEFRGRGFAAAVTAFVTNDLFDRGATHVVLQASALGFGVYERLGFAVYDQYVRFTIAPA